MKLPSSIGIFLSFRPFRRRAGIWIGGLVLGLGIFGGLLLTGCRSLPSEEAARSAFRPGQLDRWEAAGDTVFPVAQSLEGSLVVGYQGWFSTPGDGTVPGWVHYGAGRGPDAEPVPGRVTIDYWPDMSEATEEEQFPTQFRHADGRTAMLFSSAHPRTVDRHFKWMRDYDLDAAFVQRFASSLKRPPLLEHRNRILHLVRASANRHGRAYAVMYDLSGLRAGEIRQVLMEDWKRLVDRGVIGGDPAYQRHAGQPVVAVWGIGFADGRDYTLAECEELVDFLQNDPVYGGNTVMVGVPYHWRSGNRDALPDPALHRILGKADIISPWTVGRHDNLEEVEAWGPDRLSGDLAWCRARGVEYMPVIYAGFSWHNLRRSQGLERRLDQIPRLDGAFFWAHGRQVAASGASMVYVAMFDEMDEGTQIFKVTNDPPVGESPFLSYGDLPSDHYLWLAGKIRALLRGEIPPTEALPPRE